MPMSGGDPEVHHPRSQARDVTPGDVLPVQTPSGGLGPKTVDEVHHDITRGLVTIRFTDGTDWTWNEDAPVLLAPPPVEVR